MLLPLTAVLGWKWGATGAAGAMVAASGAFVVMWAVLIFRIRNEVLRLPTSPEELVEPPAELAAQ